MKVSYGFLFCLQKRKQFREDEIITEVDTVTLAEFSAKYVKLKFNTNKTKKKHYTDINKRVTFQIIRTVATIFDLSKIYLILKRKKN